MKPGQSNRSPKLTGLWSVTVREYDNGQNDSQYLRYDMATRMIHPESLGVTEQPAKDPFSPHELLLMAALENYARRTFGDGGGSL